MTPNNINRHVEALLNGLTIRLTKSRPRHSNDNALAESKNNSVVRKTFGYVHIPQQHAKLMDAFNRKYLNPCINFHRPCHFPTIETDSKGKQKKRYRQQDMMTPYDKFKSLPDADNISSPASPSKTLRTLLQNNPTLTYGSICKRLAPSYSIQSLDRPQRPHESNLHAAAFQPYLWIGKYWV